MFKQLSTRCLPMALLSLMSTLVWADYSAVAMSADGKQYPATAQLNSIAASANAIQNCRQANPQDVCELVTLNGKKLITSADVKKRLPDSPHPLYLWRLHLLPVL